MIDKIALLYYRNGKILTTRSKGKDAYYFPGGKREGSESDLETLVREIKEELSVDIIPESVKPYGIFSAQAHGKSNGVIVQMSCYTAEFTGELRPDNEIEEIRWIDYSDYDTVSPVDKLILDDLRSKGFIK